jgi:hypothetical protein
MGMVVVNLRAIEGGPGDRASGTGQRQISAAILGLR